MKFGIAQRATGEVKNGIVTITKILSYDLVASPSFSGATFENYREILRKQKLEERKKKLDILNKLS